MFFIPGWLIEILTFPGVIVHEIAHRIFCHLSGTPVYDVRYFKPLAKPAGYVVHGHPDNLRSAFLISAGPLIVNTILCAILGIVGSLQILVLDNEHADGTHIVIFWLAISIGAHAFPSNHDAREFVARVEQDRGSGLLYFTAKGFSGLLAIANALRVIWFDMIYALVVSMSLPFFLQII